MPQNDITDEILPVDRDGNQITLYDWEDHELNRNAIYDKVKQAMTKLFANKEHNGVRLSITDIDYEGPEYRTIQELKKILHEDGFMARKLRGTATLTDVKTGEVLDLKRLTLMNVPMWSNRGTFIRDGNEWGTINQTRLIPGAYSRWQNNGELETQFNVRPGTGGSMRVIFQPEKALYKFKTAGLEFHLYSLLHDIGVDDDAMRERWGDEIFQINKESYDPRTLEKAYNKLVPEWDRKQHPSRELEDKVTLIKNVLNRAQVSTLVIKNTLPNMLDKEKSRIWKQAGTIMAKVANLNTGQLQDIATYINQAADKHIDIEVSKDLLELQIMNVVTTGEVDGTHAPGVIQDNAAKVVNQIKQTRMLNGLKKKLNIDTY